MKLSTFNRLKKFMALTTSENENEALAALRQANALLSREGLTWERVLDRSVKVSEYDDGGDAPGNPHRHGSPPPRDRPPSQVLDQAFADIEGVEFDTESFNDLVNSIREQYENGKTLSPRQREIILSAAAREIAKRSVRRHR